MTTKHDEAEAKAQAKEDKLDAAEAAKAKADKNNPTAKEEPLKFGFKKAPAPVKAPPPPSIDWPKEQFTVCADWMADRKTLVPREVCEAAYDVLGYALGHVYDARKAAPKGVMTPEPSPPVAPSDAEASYVLRGCGIQYGESAAAVDWNQVIAIVISIIQQFWK